MEISYRHTHREPAQNTFGRASRWVGERPIIGGLIAGGIVVAIALARVPGVLTNSPFNALVLSGLVVAVWTVLFFFMRSFFERQGYVNRETTRRLIWRDDIFRWEEEANVLVEIESPTLQLRRPPETEGRDVVSEEQPHPVWIVIEGDRARGDASVPVRLETKVTAGEAVNYNIDDYDGGADEVLSVGEVHTLLNELDRAV